MYNAYTTKDPDTFNTITNLFSSAIKKSLNTSNYQMQWEEMETVAVSKKFPYFANDSCQTIYKTIVDNVNCTRCPNWTPALVTKMPQLILNFGSSQSLAFDLTDFFDLESENRCAVNLQFILKKIDNTDLVEGITLGTMYFSRYSGLHYDFDKTQVAFSGAHGYRPVPNPKKDGLGVIEIVITSVVVGVGMIGLGIWIYKSRKNKKLETNLN